MKTIVPLFVLLVAFSVMALPAFAGQSLYGDADSAAQDSSFIRTVPVESGMDAQEGPPASGLRSIMPLILVVVLFLLVRRILRNMGGTQSWEDHQDDDFPQDRRDQNDPEHLKDVYSNARKAWDAFSARPGEDTLAGAPRPVPVSGFDEVEFLEGAKLAFSHLVEAMDRLDPERTGLFAGANMVNEVKSRLNAGEIPVESEVVRVDAKVLERITLDGRATITVLFDGIKKTAVASPVQVRQTWKFAKDDNDPEAHWMLESLGPAEE